MYGSSPLQALTGKTSGMPPRTAFEPSSLAASLRNKFSLPLLFQLITVAPKSRTSTESPVGRVATTLPCSERTVGCGPVVEGEIALGRFGRSMMAGRNEQTVSTDCELNKKDLAFT